MSVFMYVAGAWLPECNGKFKTYIDIVNHFNGVFELIVIIVCTIDERAIERH